MIAACLWAFFSVFAPALQEETVQEGQPSSQEGSSLLQEKGDPVSELPASEQNILVLRDGSIVRGKIIGVEDQKVSLHIPRLGIEKAGIPFSRLSPASLYFVMLEHTDKPPLEARLEVVEFAIQHEMYHIAVEDLEKVLEMDPPDPDAVRQRLRQARRLAAEEHLATASSLTAMGELDRARDRLRLAMETAPQDSELVTRAETKLLELEERRAQAAEAAKRAAPPDLASRLPEALERAYRLYERGVQARQRGLEIAGDLGDSEDLLLDSASRLRRARDLVERSAGQGDAPVSEAVEELRTRIRYQLLDTYVELGHHYIVAGSTLEAYRYSALAQAVDPDAPKVLSLRESVAAATADDRPLRRRRLPRER